MSAAPATAMPTVEASRRPLDSLPPDARKLYRRRSCTLVEAVLFLGTLKPKTNEAGAVIDAGGAAYARAKRYIERTAPIKARPPYDPNELLPKMVGGEYVEIPCVKVGSYVVDTHMLVNMRYGSVSPW